MQVLIGVWELAVEINHKQWEFLHFTAQTIKTSNHHLNVDKSLQIAPHNPFEG